MRPRQGVLGSLPKLLRRSRFAETLSHTVAILGSCTEDSARVSSCV